MPRRSSLHVLSISQIEAELRRRSRVVRRLERKRATLEAKIAGLDDQIRLNGGSGRAGGGGGGGGGGRVRPRNDVTLVGALSKALSGKTLGVTEAADAVRKSGYVTHAENFRTMVNIALIKNKKLFRKVSRGQYTAA